MAKRSISEQVRAEVVQAYKAGTSTAEVAGTYGIARQTVYKLLAEAGIEIRKDWRKALTPAGEDEVVQEYLAGRLVKDIAADRGLIPHTIRNIVRRRGVELRQRTAHNLVLTDEVVRGLAARYMAGEITQQAAADEAGVSQTAIERAFRRIGVSHTGRKAAGGLHGMWKGGRHVNGSGYVGILLDPDDPLVHMTGSNGYALEHRVVMARALGRPLTRSETVHHINGDRTDNRLENLQLRQGRHGTGVVMACQDCGSHNVRAVEISD